MKRLILVALVFPSITFAQSPCCSLGDVNGSGTVSAADLSTIQKHLLDIQCLDSPEATCQGDVDGDGLLTEADRDLIQRYLLGYIQTFPRCGDLDGNGFLDWASNEGDLNFFTSCFFNPMQPGCANADADNDGDIDADDLDIFLRHREGDFTSFPGCECGEGACADPM